ncbi:hypothetical protein BC829DRAFT_494407 [Chytridium lagenaria]|nr:hypothetical protein BC829DRAFT_494407 [Chytridium lagenaria]
MSTPTVPADCAVVRSIFPTSVISATGNCCFASAPGSPNPISCVGSRITRISILNTDLSTITFPPDSLSPLTQLQRLVLYNTSIPGQLPDAFNLPQLSTLSLGYNEFTGSLPDWIGNLRNLNVLYLFGNRFEGPLPDALWGLTELEELALETNGFTGVVSEQIGNLVNLRNLWLRNNRFAGPVPAALSRMTNLNLTYLENNYFGGETIPDILYRVNSNKILLQSPVTQCTEAFSSANLPIPSDFQANLISSNAAASTIRANVPATTRSSVATSTSVDFSLGANTISTGGSTEAVRFAAMILGPVIGIVAITAVAAVVLNRKLAARKLDGSVFKGKV